MAPASLVEAEPKMVGYWDDNETCDPRELVSRVKKISSGASDP